MADHAPPLERTVRDHLIRALAWSSAHHAFEDVVAGWPEAQRGTVPDGLPYSGWQLVEHIRIAQADLLAFSRDDAYTAPDWPDAYWPDAAAPPSPEAWDAAIEQVRADRAALQALADDPARDLAAPLPHGDGQTLLRSLLLVIDHTAYHVGQLVALRRVLGIWPPEQD